jgi:hypothetical protein
MSELPVELVVNIIGFIAMQDVFAAKQVCKLWYEILKERFWSNVVVGVCGANLKKLSEFLKVR